MNGQQESNTNQQADNTMSPFCEALMDVTGTISDKRTISDAAITICTDGVRVASRACGLQPNIVNMLLSKMTSDDKFAEVIIEASMRYSHHMLGRAYKPFKEDTPINKAFETTLN